VSSRLQFNPLNSFPSEETNEVVFFNDGTIRVTQKAIFIGAPYNHGFAMSQVIGVSYFKEKIGFSAFFGFLVGLFFLFSSVFFISDHLIFGIFLAAISFFVFKKSMSLAWYVAIQFGGLNNHTLTMKSKHYAVELSDAILCAINSNQRPPSGGETVSYQPYFPSPVSSHN
jgi:hypothetical protein